MSYNGPLTSLITEDPFLVGLGRSHILPYAKPYGARPVDSVYSDQMLSYFKRHDSQLKQIFSWYTTLDEADSNRITWDWVRTRGLTMSRSRFMLFLLNFKTIPVLISKNQAIEAFTKHHRDIFPDLDNDGLSYSQFLSAIANIALTIAKLAKDRIEQLVTGSPDDIRILQNYIKCHTSGSRHRISLTEAMEAMLARRRVAALRSTSPPRAEERSGGWGQEPCPTWMIEGLDPVLQTVKRKEWDLNQRDSCNAILEVVSRREETRMKLALTRVQNTYRDVRPAPLEGSGLNLGNTGLEPSHVIFRLGEGKGANEWPTTGMTNETEEQEVAFFSGTLQVKTPRRISTLQAKTASFLTESLTLTKGLIPPPSAAQRAEAIIYLENQKKRVESRVPTTLIPIRPMAEGDIDSVLGMLPRL